MRALSFAAAVVVMSGLTAWAQAASPPADEHPALPAGPGRELMIRVCSPCHSPDSAAEQQLDPAGWKTLVDLMASKGAVATDVELDEIVRYLANAFPAEEREARLDAIIAQTRDGFIYRIVRAGWR